MRLDNILLSDFSDLLDFGIILIDNSFNLISYNSFISNNFKLNNTEKSLIPFLKNFKSKNNFESNFQNLYDAAKYVLNKGILLKNSVFSLPDGKTNLIYYNINIKNIESGIILTFNNININNALYADKIYDKTLQGYTKLKFFIDNAPDSVFLFDKEGKITNCNKAATAVTGYSREELLSLNYSNLLSAGSADTFKTYIKSLSHKSINSACFEYLTKKGNTLFLVTDCVKLGNDEFMTINKDVTDNNIIKDKLYYDCYHDNLTGLFNRLYITKKLESINKNAALFPVCVVIGDINGLKVVNDALGRNWGDKLIKKTAKMIKGVCCETDIIGKWGGDEFIIISTNSSEEKANQLIFAIKRQCNKRNIQMINLSISFGHCIKTVKKNSFEDTVKTAENMMLKNKIYEGASFRSQTIDLILNTLHEKNKREEQHSVRVSRICVEIGKAVNLTESEINKLKVIGLLHDIGKIGVSESILNKMGKLTDDEFEQIKKHSEIGYRILSSSTQTSELAHDVLDHHERFDGRGYPRGKAGEKLSVMTKILTIADSYDAMTSERPYKNAMSKSEAIEELLRHSSKQFDPYLVEVFINKILNNVQITL